MRAHSVAVPLFNGPAHRPFLRPTGRERACRRCGASFPVLDRTDCPAVLCRACRPAPVNRGIQETVRVCAAPGCEETFHPPRASVVRCEAHRRRHRGRPVRMLGRRLAQTSPPSFTAGLPNAQPVPCRTCGEPVPRFEIIGGECLGCAPLAARKGAA